MKMPPERRSEMGKITLDVPRESYATRPFEDPTKRLARLEAEVREERRDRSRRLLKYGKAYPAK